eukprot:scaffold259_cov158-Amphora_coffeaeformis.AAC.8
MFPIKAKDDVPVTQVVVNAVAVRGQLGPLTVWVSRQEESDHAVTAATAAATNRNNNNNNNNNNTAREYRFPLQSRYWQKVYQATHAPSQREYQWLDFSKNPIIMLPGQVRALYIHSTAQGDEAIVYDNANVRFGAYHHYGAPLGGRRRRAAGAGGEPRYQDNYIQLLTGKAHLSPRPFGQTPIWGWGNAWRDHREFVGQVAYGVRFALWQPVLTVSRYGPAFQAAIRTMLGCQRRLESNVALLPDECLYYIFNMCRWDWFDDTTQALKEQRRRQRRRAREQRSLLAAAAAATTTTATAAAGTEVVRRVTQESSTHAMEESQHNDDDDDDDDDSDGNYEEEVNDEDMMGDDDDDDDDEEEEDEEEEEILQEEDSDSDESAWERQHGYRADTNVFIYRDVSSDDDTSQDEEEDDDDDDPQAAAVERQAWFRRHFARIHVLQALAQAEENAQDVAMHVHGGREDSDSSDDDGVDEDDDDDDGDYEIGVDYDTLQDTEDEE